MKLKFRKPVTTIVAQQQTDGSKMEITDKIKLENVIIEKTLRSTIRSKELAHYLITLGCTDILGNLEKAHR